MDRRANDDAGETAEKSRARRAFVAAVLAIVVAETFLPTLCGWDYRRDVLEQLLIGREWVVGSFKHPAATTWIAELFWLATGRADFAPYLASACCVAATLCATWRLARRFLSERLALVAGLAPVVLWYLSGESYRFNNNITLVCFWSATVWAFHRALVDGKTRWWVATGLLTSAALWSKYAALSLALSLPLYLATNREARAYWRTSGPYWALGVAFATFAPQLAFFCRHSAELSAYSRTESCSAAEFPVAFVVGWLAQLAIVAPTSICVAPLLDGGALKAKLTTRTRRNAAGTNAGTSGGTNAETNESPSTSGESESVVEPKPVAEPIAAPGGFANDFLAKMFVYPIIIQTAVQCVALLPLYSSGYAIQFWPILATVVLFYAPTKRPLDAKSLATSRTLLIGFAAGLLATIPVYTLAAPFSTSPSIRFFPGREFAREIESIWAREVGPEPIPFVAGWNFYPWKLAVYCRPEPRFVDPRLGAWATDADANREGCVVVWPADDGSNEIPGEWRERFPNAKFVGALDLKYRRRSPETPRARIGVAIVFPTTDDSRAPSPNAR